MVNPSYSSTFTNFLVEFMDGDTSQVLEYKILADIITIDPGVPLVEFTSDNLFK
jgi:hypothetical protein